MVGHARPRDATVIRGRVHPLVSVPATDEITKIILLCR